jgi:hypothetical protein
VKTNNGDYSEIKGLNKNEVLIKGKVHEFNGKAMISEIETSIYYVSYPLI